MKIRSVTVIIWLSLMLISSCESANTTIQPVTDATTNWYTLYLTHPGEAGTGLAVESALVDSILSAESTIDLALYSFSLGTIADALIEAKSHGVEVRMVMEADNMDSYQVKRLLAAGIPIHADTADGLMHDKFVVIDDNEVWTGSMNLTITSAQEDANNLVRIVSPVLADDYTVEFEGMYQDGLFGERHRPQTPYPLLTIETTTLEVYFPPNDGASNRLVELINEANNSIVFLASNFTSDPLSAALIRAHDRGVEVAGLMDAENAVSDTGSDYRLLVESGIPVVLDIDPGNMHHKVLIIDDAIVVFGSYNFTASADKRNDENLLIIHDPELAARFLKEYMRLIE